MIAADLDEFFVDNFIDTVEFLAVKSAGVADLFRTMCATDYTSKPVPVYWDPVREKLAVDARDQSDIDVLLCKSAAERVVGRDRVIDSDLTDENWWVKVAHSPTLRRVGELLHVFPSKKPVTGMEGKPVAAMVASGLVGAGLGYGTGWLGEQIIPDRFKQHGTLRKNLALAGGLAGLGIGAVPGLINKHDGRDFNDPTLFSGDSDDTVDGGLMPEALLGSNFKRAAASISKQAYSVFPGGDNPAGSTMGSAYQRYTPVVRLDELGEVMSSSRADAKLTAMTMGAVYGANQFGDPNAVDGAVTPHQMGLFGQAMGAAGGGLKGYATGFLVGKGLGLLTGLPQAEQNNLRNAGAVLGVVGSLVPCLFG